MNTEILYNQSLIIDLYELTMAAGYFENDMQAIATFEVFVREMPPHRSYLVAAGLQQVVNYLLNLQFTEEELQYLRSLPVFKHVSQSFFDYLSDFKFNGDVWAMPEGEIFFPGEPLLRVTAPIIEAQIIETFVLSVLNFESMVASKAARVVYAANSDGKLRGVMEFGSRRSHGPEASILAARASYIAGCIGTSNVLAGMRFGIPVYGTAAHSWTMAFESELEAFRAYQKVFPDSTILLIDTYDVNRGIENAINTGKKFNGVRIDSGDLLEHSKYVRQVLNKHGLQNITIVASGDLNEYRIKKLLERGAPIDSFGVGTQMSTSADAPFLGGIYKLVELEKNGQIQYRAKFSEHKATYPGRKQVYRIVNSQGKYLKDVIGLVDDNIPEDHRPLLKPVIENGNPAGNLPDMIKIQQYFLENFRHLDNGIKQIENPGVYTVRYSRRIQELFNSLKVKERD